MDAFPPMTNGRGKVDPHEPTASECPGKRAEVFPSKLRGSKMQVIRAVVGVDTAKPAILGERQ